eukprot:CAMPEP_0197666370 /NCGR_PEP_ID=MMETSP1338-20131121/62310_1 /TAXON_ID=43686 ORGANISM="Pelagodinium beii, Strain RCC1491" /NCGR_SAMPLE_ID=MMETSP1338 /ASSEMBLY_ACC=CAM_ASM_000754 /LENGTH=324 /DNA_ID=CAMNT_0043245389 /DNA_START=25 /DNA_END=996 /DNA_ORIENTATION=+
MACACCKPHDFQCAPSAVPVLAARFRKKIFLTVSELSGATLAKLSVEPKSLVADLKLSIEQQANLPPGCVVRWLAWGTTVLQDDQLLEDVGIPCGTQVDLVAICADAIIGDFEVYQPGCPTCDYNAELKRVRFFADGTALIQGGPYDVFTKYRYSLGEFSKTRLERQLRFVEDVADAASPVYDGVLQLSATNALNRRLKIPDMDIDVEDVRFLRERGQSFLQLKMQIMLSYHLDCFHSLALWYPEALNHSLRFDSEDLPFYSEEDVWAAYSNAWTTAKQEERMIEADGLAESYDRYYFQGGRRAEKAKTPKQKRQVEARKKCTW